MYLTPCAIICVVDILRYDPRVVRNWVELGDRLDIKTDVMVGLKHRFNTGNVPVFDVLKELLETWDGEVGDETSLQELSRRLVKMGAKDAAQKVPNCDTSCPTGGNTITASVSNWELWTAISTLVVGLCGFFYVFRRLRTAASHNLPTDLGHRDSAGRNPEEGDLGSLVQTEFPNPDCPEEEFFEFDPKAMPEHHDQPGYFKGKRLDVKVVMTDNPYNGEEAGKLYKMTSKPRGVALIINNQFKGRGEDERLGSEWDEHYMGHLFSQLGFLTWVARNVKSTQLDSLFTGYRTMLKSEMDCSVIIVMSHGTFNTVLMADNKSVHLQKQLLAQVSNEKWIGAKNGFDKKPKLFILQACQGFKEKEDSGEKGPDLNHVRLCYPTLPGHPAMRQEKTGSRYIYHLAKVFMENAHQWDINALMSEVANVMVEMPLPKGFERQKPQCQTLGQFHSLYFNPGHYVQEEEQRE